MKLAFLIAAFGFITVTQAGVAVLHHHEEQEVLQAFEKYCSHGSEGGEFHGAKIWCKFAKEEHEEVVKHQVIVPAPMIPDSVIFVQPAPVKYHNQIEVSGNKGIGPKVKIYVLQNKSSHSVESKIKQGEIVGTKPTVYFVKKSGDEGHGSHSHSEYGSQAPEGDHAEY